MRETNTTSKTRKWLALMLLFMFSMSFSTMAQSPTISFTEPADDRFGVSINLGTLTMNMSEDVKMHADPGVEGVNYYFELRNGSGTEIKAFDVNSADVEISGSTVILKNIPTLTLGTEYHVYYQLNGKWPIVDLDDNMLSSFSNNTTWNFKTVSDGGTVPFVTTWETTTADETITIPTDGTGYYYSVDWGDGSSDDAVTRICYC